MVGLVSFIASKVGRIPPHNKSSSSRVNMNFFHSPSNETLNSDTTKLLSDDSAHPPITHWSNFKNPEHHKVGYRRSLINCFLHVAKEQLHRATKVLRFSNRNESVISNINSLYANSPKCQIEGNYWSNTHNKFPIFHQGHTKYSNQREINENAPCYQARIVKIKKTAGSSSLFRSSTKSSKYHQYSSQTHSSSAMINPKSRLKNPHEPFFPKQIVTNCAKSRLDSKSTHAHLLFGEVITQNLWNDFQIFLDAGLEINQPQKMLVSEGKQSQILAFASVLDLFLFATQQNISDSNMENIGFTDRVWPKLLADLLRKGARLNIVSDNNYEQGLGGIQEKTVFLICEHACIQFGRLSYLSITPSQQVFDHAGMIRQLLKAGLKPPRYLWLKTKDSSREKLLKLQFFSSGNLYFDLLYGISFWFVTKSKKQQTFSPILQSFLVLLFNLIYSGASILPENLKKFDMILQTFSNDPIHTEIRRIIPAYHKAFIKLLSCEPPSLFILTRRVVRDQLGAWEHLSHCSSESTNLMCESFADTFSVRLSTIPDHVRQSVAYLESIRLKRELDYLTNAHCNDIL